MLENKSELIRLRVKDEFIGCLRWGVKRQPSGRVPPQE
jgi:hypothetical protein